MVNVFSRLMPTITYELAAFGSLQDEFTETVNCAIQEEIEQAREDKEVREEAAKMREELGRKLKKGELKAIRKRVVARRSGEEPEAKRAKVEE